MVLSAVSFVLATVQKVAALTTATPELITQLHRFAEYSAAAYCPENYLAFPPNDSICPEEVCPHLQNANIARVHSIAGNGKPYAIFALDHENRQIIISFRGTQTDQDWDTNLDFIYEDASRICSGCWAQYVIYEDRVKLRYRYKFC